MAGSTEGECAGITISTHFSFFFCLPMELRKPILCIGGGAENGAVARCSSCDAKGFRVRISHYS